MKEMIKKVKERREGFTMAELLIVVAIIAVLVAIAIPVFSSKLEMSREATDLANLRAAYAEAQVSAMTGETADTSITTVTVQQTKDGWQGDNVNAKIGGKYAVNADNLAKLGETYKKVVVTADNTGAATFTCTAS